MVHIKEPMLLIGKSSPCGGSGFPLSLSEWSFTICPKPYNRKSNVLNTSLNKTFPSLLPGALVISKLSFPAGLVEMECGNEACALQFNYSLTLYLPMMHWGNIHLTPSI